MHNEAKIITKQSYVLKKANAYASKQELIHKEANVQAANKLLARKFKQASKYLHKMLSKHDKYNQRKQTNL
jgi:hypothetical protein